MNDMTAAHAEHLRKLDELVETFNANPQLAALADALAERKMTRDERRAMMQQERNARNEVRWAEKRVIDAVLEQWTSAPLAALRGALIAANEEHKRIAALLLADSRMAGR